MNVGNLDILSSLLVLAPDRGAGGEVLVQNDAWKEVEKMWLGRVVLPLRGKFLPTGDREATEVDVMFEGWFRPTVQVQRRLVAQGVTYTIQRVEPREGRKWMWVYVQIVK